MIAASLEAIEDCHDCADFILVPLLWSRAKYADKLDAAVVARIDAAMLGYRYWMDERGNDVQWYFSENHALLFHTAAYLAGHILPEGRFVRSGRTGKEQSAVGGERVHAWLDHFEKWEMAEFNSAPYFPDRPERPLRPLRAGARCRHQRTCGKGDCAPARCRGALGPSRPDHRSAGAFL
jgi:hypothetical protein